MKSCEAMHWHRKLRQGTSLKSFDAFCSHSWGEDGKDHQRVCQVAKDLQEHGVQLFFASFLALMLPPA